VLLFWNPLTILSLDNGNILDIGYNVFDIANDRLAVTGTGIEIEKVEKSSIKGKKFSYEFLMNLSPDES